MPEVKRRVLELLLTTNGTHELGQRVFALLYEIRRLGNKITHFPIFAMSIKMVSILADLRCHWKISGVFERFDDGSSFVDYTTDLSLPLTRTTEYNGDPFRSLSAEYEFYEGLQKRDAEFGHPPELTNLLRKRYETL